MPAPMPASRWLPGWGWALTALAALPWLWPLTAGPSAAAAPYLASAALGALLWGAWPRQRWLGQQVVAGGWALAAGVSAVIALLQYLDMEGSLRPWVNVSRPGQAFGNLRQPNQLATLLALGLLSLRWWWQALAAGGARRTRMASVALAGLALLITAALAATASRVGLLELLALGALTLWWTAPPQRRPVALALGALLLAYALAAWALPAALQSAEGVAGRSMAQRLQHAESTCGSRLILWRNVLHLVAQKPWTGWGWGDLAYAHYITPYEGARFCHILDNAHNLPLHLAVTLGVPVALLACALLLWGLWRARPWAQRDSTSQLAWGALAAIGLHSLVEYPLWYGPFQIAVAMALWLLWPQRARPAPTAAAHGRPWRPSLRWLAVPALAAVAWAGWDYYRVSQVYLPPHKRAAAYRQDALALAQTSRLFAGEALFAQVGLMQPTPQQAAQLLPLALRALHFSPEPRVITRVIDSARLLGQHELADLHEARFRSAFASRYAEWTAQRASAASAAAP